VILGSEKRASSESPNYKSDAPCCPLNNKIKTANTQYIKNLFSRSKYQVPQKKLKLD